MGVVLRWRPPVGGLVALAFVVSTTFSPSAGAPARQLPVAYARAAAAPDDRGGDAFFLRAGDDDTCWVQDGLSGRLEDCATAEPPGSQVGGPAGSGFDGRSGLFAMAGVVGAFAFCGAAYWLTTKLEGREDALPPETLT
ncbi:hypothetical protein MF672_000785 [Actinomadura sp. ATCC 31491]|uniref:Transmembrane protein n=1 Tax=Actinomadura luzonensis TaxID=2805427 RepID=A0ABT0FJU8_9ACTN|nr:hypothetical protein [Actinomadura luzonensis]MCK2212340.1 hypothetical protein [Actinomadura luzonensis]